MPLRLLVFAAFLLLSACSRPARAQQTRGQAPPPPLAREFRGAWVATVDNIDWPSRPGLPAAQARAELDAIVARAVELRLNALVFQVRPAGDALYRSALEPWSEWLTGAQGRPPDEAWDPLQHAIARCHAHGLQLHAWFNPFRATHPAGKSPPAAGHVLAKLPAACVSYGAYRWMDPGDERAAAWSLAVIRDVVARYDLDGVHLDDYFYPYPEKGADFPDDASWQRYRRGGGKLGRADWRRANIDGFVQRLYTTVHREKPWVMVGISPFGIARPGVPKGIAAGVDQFAQLYADVPKWLREGWLDYLAPQLYWPIDQPPQSFAVLLPWWHAQNSAGRHLWPGIAAGRALAQQPPTRATELADQITLIRAQKAPAGFVLYSMKALRRDAPAVAGALREQLLAEPALPPACDWLGVAAPALRARAEGRAGRWSVRWEPDPALRFVAVQVLGSRGWTTQAIAGAAAGSAALPADATAVALTPIGRSGLAGPVASPPLR